MGYTKLRYSWGGLTSALLSILLISGCASEKAAQKDPFFEKWNTLSQTATGYSPTPRKKASALAEELLREAGIADRDKVAEAVRTLPTQPVTLKMRQADVKAVLRSLAKSVDRNILVKNDIKGEMTIDFHEVPWNQAFNSILNTQGLAYVWQGEIIRVMTLDDMEMDLKRQTQERGIQMVAPLLTVVVPIDYAKPKELKDNLETFLTMTKENKPRGSVRVDEHSNSLVISAIREDLLKMMPIIEKVDKPTPQIMIKANIVETTKETARELGIQWGGMYRTASGDGKNLWITPGGGLNANPITQINPMTGGYNPAYGLGGLASQGMAVNFPATASAITAAGGLGSLGIMLGEIGSGILEMQLNAMQKDSKLNILSSPSITTRDNQMAFTENGERVPYITNQNSGGTITQTTMFEDVVLRLEITPHVIDDQSLSMKIIVKKDEVDPVRNVQGNPYIIKKKTETNLVVRNGETIVISGLTKQRSSKGDTGLPWFKDIPVLGYLVKNDSMSEKMEEVLIFITPKILAPYQIAAVNPPVGEQKTGSDAGKVPEAVKTPKP